MSKRVTCNVIVRDSDGAKVTVYAGDEVPAWAEDQVPESLVDGGSYVPKKAPPAEAFGIGDVDAEDSEDD